MTRYKVPLTLEHMDPGYTSEPTTEAKLYAKTGGNLFMFTGTTETEMPIVFNEIDDFVIGSEYKDVESPSTNGGLIQGHLSVGTTDDNAEVTTNTFATNHENFTNKTATLNDQHSIVSFINILTATANCHLPNASSCEGRIYDIFVVTAGTHGVRINPNGSQKINGQDNIVITTNNKVYSIIAYNGDWVILESN